MNTFQLITELYKLVDFKDNPKHHPESNVLDHSFQCFRLAKIESDNAELHIAALFHDVGKIIRDPSVKHSPDHELHSVSIMKSCGYNNSRVFHLIENHMRVHKYMSGEMTRPGKAWKLTSDPLFKEMIMLGRWDTMARKPGYEMPDQDRVVGCIERKLWRTNN